MNINFDKVQKYRPTQNLPQTTCTIMSCLSIETSLRVYSGISEHRHTVFRKTKNIVMTYCTTITLWKHIYNVKTVWKHLTLYVFKLWEQLERFIWLHRDTLIYGFLIRQNRLKKVSWFDAKINFGTNLKIVYMYISKLP